MLLTEFFNQPEGDSYAKFTSASPIAEDKCNTKKDNLRPEGPTMVRTKTTSSKAVSTRVPVKEDSWSNPGGQGNAWNDGTDQWSDGRGQWSESTEGVDSITVDVPLFIRLLEYAREDAKTDMDLHAVTERITQLSQEDRTLTMQDYDSICPSKEDN